MGDTMALATGVEIFYHRLGMGNTVAFLASLNGRVFFRVALSALESRMFGFIFIQHFVRFSVTVGTDRVGRIIRIHDLEGFMRRMTG